MGGPVPTNHGAVFCDDDVEPLLSIRKHMQQVRKDATSDQRERESGSSNLF